MLKITGPEVHDAMDWSSLIEAMREAHRGGKRPEIGDLLLKSGDKSLLVRASIFGAAGIGLKAVTVFPGNPARQPALPTVQGEFLLFDEDTGSVLASIDGAAITPWKTAADSALGASILARPDAAVFAMIGAGTMAQPLIEALFVAHRCLTEIRLWNRTRAGAERLAERIAAPGRRVTISESLEAAIRDADIISSATLSGEPLIRGEWLKPGAHLDLVGAFTLEMREADDEALRRGRIFVDTRETTIGHIGEIMIPMNSGVIGAADIEADLFELCGDAGFTRAPDDITIYKNGGGAHLDLITGRHIHELVMSGNSS
jgi:ornithine cyclodeaminase